MHQFLYFLALSAWLLTLEFSPLSEKKSTHTLPRSTNFQQTHLQQLDSRNSFREKTTTYHLIKRTKVLHNQVSGNLFYSPKSVTGHSRNLFYSIPFHSRKLFCSTISTRFYLQPLIASNLSQGTRPTTSHNKSGNKLLLRNQGFGNLILFATIRNRYYLQTLIARNSTFSLQAPSAITYRYYLQTYTCSRFIIPDQKLTSSMISNPVHTTGQC